MIIWRGAGIVTVIIVAVLTVACMYLGHHLIGGPHFQGRAYGASVGLLFAAVANWFVGTAANRDEGGHSLFFIPMQWWSIPMAFFAVTSFIDAVRTQ